MAPPQDAENPWQKHQIAETYQLAEQVTRPFASLALEQAGFPDYIGPLVLFDDACGTGAATKAAFALLKEQGEEGEKKSKKMKIMLGDTAEGMVKWCEELIKEERWEGAEVKIVDAVDTKLPSNTYTHVISTFGLASVPSPNKAVSECHRLLVPGGSVALTFWPVLAWCDIVGRALASLPGSPPMPSSDELIASFYKGEWHKASYVAEKLGEAGFVDVRVEEKTLKLPGGTAKQFAQTMYMPSTLIKNAFWNEEEREKCGDLMRGALEKEVEAMVGKEGVLMMDWTSIIATGRKE